MQNLTALLTIITDPRTGMTPFDAANDFVRRMGVGHAKTLLTDGFCCGYLMAACSFDNRSEGEHKRIYRTLKNWHARRRPVES